MTSSKSEQLHHHLYDYFERNLPRYIKFLKEMVVTNSFTANPSGVNVLGELTSRKFVELGFNKHRSISANPLHGDHLVLRRISDKERTIGSIATVSHLDTVYPPDEEAINDFRWRAEGDLIYGPGTVDIKGGTLMIFMVLEALMMVAPEFFESINWYVLLNAAEEELDPEFKRVCLDLLPEKVDACLVFEGGRSRDRKFALVTARKGMITYKITVNGRAAHAGSAHQNGANALVQLAATIDQIARFTDYEKELTFNVGKAAGGTVLNRVPHTAEASGEARAFSPNVLKYGLTQLLSLERSATVRSLKDNFPCTVDIEILGNWQPWPSNQDSERLLSVWQESASEMGYGMVGEKRGGLSDGNWLWESMPTLDGLGPSGGNAHCSERSDDGSKDQEFVRLSSFVPKATLNALALHNLFTRDNDAT